MKLYLKRDKTDENSRYIVYSQSGEELYRITGKYSASSQRMYIMRGAQCIAKIRDAHLGVLRSCFVTLKGNSFHIVINSSPNKFTVVFHGVSFHIRGDVLNKSYDILDIDNSVVASVCRRLGSSHNALEININDDKFEILSIASVACLDVSDTSDLLMLQAT